MFATASHAWQRWSTIKQQNGLSGAFSWLVGRAGWRLINLGIAEVIWLDLNDMQMAGDPPAGFEYRFLTSEDIARYVSPENELGPEHVARAAAGQDLCFAALQDGKLAAYGWYAIGCIEGAECDAVSLSFPPHVSYMYKGFTHPDFRGQRLHGYIMRMALEALARDRGITSLVSTVSFINWPSLKSCDRLGYRRLGRLVKAGWGVCGFRWYPKAAKKLGVRFGWRADMSSRKPVA
ncbi:MAG TPA: hypothetical protein VL096_10155 [Pirellulaceae bacterium]|nr:hypothetical protein [Pirellulaceae bacterium]